MRAFFYLINIIMKNPSLIYYKEPFIVYNFNLPEVGFPVLCHTKDLFLKYKDRKLNVIIDVSREGESNPLDDSFLGEFGDYWNDLHSLLSEYTDDTPTRILTESIILLSNDANISNKYTEWLKIHKVKRVFGRCIYRPQTLLDRSIGHFNNTPTQLKKSFKSKHFICMNGASMPHRFDMVEMLFANNWNNKGYISYLNRYGSTSESTDFFKGQTLKLDFDSETIDDKGNQEILPSEYMDVCFDIVTESIVCETSLHITEKVWKPILNEKPFIILGPKFVHQHLRDHFGIEPYFDLFNYEFDTLNYPERLHSMKEKNLKRLFNMDIDKLNEIVNSASMKKQMSYNKEKLLAYSEVERDGDSFPIENYTYDDIGSSNLPHMIYDK